MAQQEQGAPSDAWARVKSRLRAELGEDVFASWFRGVEVEQVDDEVVRLTVATRFLRNWLRSHYYDFVLRLSRGEWPTVERVERLELCAATATAGGSPSIRSACGFSRRSRKCRV